MLSINSLSVKFGSATILSDVSCNIPEKQCVSIIGANGAGKTTLLKAISGVVPIQNGEIEFKGQNITGLRPDQVIKLGIAHCPEGRRVFPAMSVRENLEIGGLVNRKNTPAMLNKCGEMFPRIRERMDQLAGTLSGGEQQMLAIARALMCNPQIVMFDEPSLGLAPNVVEEVGNIVIKLRDAGHTILLVEQNAFMAMSISNYTYVLENGQIKKHGPSQELLHDDDIRKAYLGM